MSYIQKSLSAGEEVEACFKLHWLIWLPVYLWLLLGIPTLGLAWLVAIPKYMRLKCTEHGSTNKRVIIKTGFISRKTDEMRIKSIEKVVIEKTLMGRIFGYGSIRMTGKGVSDMIFKGMSDPLEVKKTIESVSNPID